ncbi:MULTISPECIES: 2-C-methyl-D-erythritol 4-phosphate cytidylyltransferase [unclassified Crossiella]|uniref:2-C-methyl-D-erythritol 4-phosphate cytidylyltransferase n=1 Tax=unclassified Crossiella TaxID=2620835 RepID=UPI001FFECEDB|nr:MULTISPECIES: 2-C-methyl-D-erythritol 4-phosphate cytidylyltransferase [unclassified Crossiella]MCK2237809.1 2-C-methyl-D-erythritol 4-phosphate cytidylyltransferase [Crossiella sp. S99.2]MCK2255095.1 2-C-methyl-D-erythritol 4-phosphate cytidylyltransferase [Crossiella sp. S99.1]
MSVVALVPAAGRGERLGAGVPKALVEVGGEPLLVHAVRGLWRSGCVQQVVVAAPRSEMDVVTAALASVGAAVHVVVGGAERSESVKLALDAALEIVPDAEVVLVHDAARAFTPPELTAAVVEAVRAGAKAVIPALPVADTIKQVDAEGVVRATPDRTTLRAVQTPQGFAVDVLRRAHEAALADGVAATDDAGLVERIGIPVHTVPGHADAMKVTTPFDLTVANALLAARTQAVEGQA